MLDDLVVVRPILKALGYSAGSAASFTMSIQPDGVSRPVKTDEWNDCEPPEFGGARRDRTDDLKLAKLALSQLSYAPFLAAPPHQAKDPGKRAKKTAQADGGPRWTRTTDLTLIKRAL